MNNMEITRLEKIFSDMLTLPLYDLNFDDSDEFFGKINSVSLKNRAHVSYGDVLCLLHYLPDSYEYQRYERGEREEIRDRLLYRLFMAMKNSMDSNETVRNFMSLTIDEYFNHLSRGAIKETEEKIASDAEFLRNKALCCSEYKLSEGSTLLDLADEIIRITNRENKSEEEYRKAVHICNEDLYYFLVKYVRKRYSGKFFDFFKQCR